VRESFARQGLMGLLGAQIVRVGHGTCEIEVPYSDEITQQRCFHGAVAGVLAGFSYRTFWVHKIISSGKERTNEHQGVRGVSPAVP
jgi:hypothetical protein